MDFERIFQTFFVFHSCEDKYEYSDFIMEFWSVITSLFYAVPYIYIRLNGTYVPETLIVSKILVVEAILSSLYHIYLHALTQFLDQAGIIVVLYAFLVLNHIPFTVYEKFLVALFFILGVVHAGFMGLCLLIFFVRLLGFLLLYGIKTKRYSVVWTIISLAVAALFLLADITLCQYQIFEHFHSLWHIWTQIGFLLAINEMDYFHKYKKKYIPMKNGHLDLDSYCGEMF